MTVKDLMTRDVVTVEPGESLSALRELFDREKFHHVLVVEDGRLVGVISDRDVLQAVSPFLNTFGEQDRGLNTLAQKMQELIRRAPVTITGDTRIEEAAALMLEEDASCLPVLSAAGELEGVVTSRDLLRHLSRGVWSNGTAG